jgi:glucose dehydrogenase
MILGPIIARSGKPAAAVLWQTPALDRTWGVVFFLSRQPCSAVRRGSRAGDNLFTSSVVALDSKTGKLRWYYQGRAP